MIVPSPTQGRTEPSTQGLDYLRPAQADTSAIGEGLQRLGGALERAQAQSQQDADQLNKLKLADGYANLQADQNKKMDEYNQSADLSDTKAPEVALKEWDTASSKFQSQITDPELRAQYKLRFDVQRAAVEEVARKNQLGRNGEYAKQVIDKQQTQAGVDVGTNPDSVAVAKKSLNENIDLIPDSMVSKGEKEIYKQKADEYLSTIYMKQRAVKKTIDVGSASGLIMSREGFRSDPYQDVNHLRIGFGSDTVTLPDGSVREVTAGMKISREDATRDLNRRVAETQTGVAKQIGANVWGALPDNVKGPLTSIAYNYGSLPNRILGAVKSGNPDQIAKAVLSLSNDNHGINAGRRQQEAAIILGHEGAPPAALASGGGQFTQGSLDNDPNIASVPWETRQAVYQQAAQDANHLLAQQSAEDKAQYESQLNELLVGINDHKKGAQDLEQFRSDHPSMDFEDINKVQTLLKKQTEDVSDMTYFQSAMASPGGIVNTDDDKLKRGAAATLDKSGALGAVSQGDQKVYNDAVLPMISKGIVPDNVKGTLTTMMGSTDPKRWGAGMDFAAQFAGRNPTAFDRSFDDTAKQQVLSFESQRNYRTADELYKQMGPAADAQTYAYRKQISEQAHKNLTEKNSPDYVGQRAINDLTKTWSGAKIDTGVGYGPLQAQMFNDWSELYKQELVNTNGDSPKAYDNSIKMVQDKYKPFTIEGQTVIAPDMPNQYYAPHDDSFDWQADQARSEFQIGHEHTIKFLATPQTQADAAALKKGTSKDLPSYAVGLYRPDGTFEGFAHGPDGKPAQIRFQKPQLLNEIESLQTQVKRQEIDLSQLEGSQRTGVAGRGPQKPVDAALNAHISDEIQAKRSSLEITKRELDLRQHRYEQSKYVGPTRFGGNDQHLGRVLLDSDGHVVATDNVQSTLESHAPDMGPSLSGATVQGAPDRKSGGPPTRAHPNDPVVMEQAMPPVGGPPSRPHVETTPSLAASGPGMSGSTTVNADAPYIAPDPQGNTYHPPQYELHGAYPPVGGPSSRPHVPGAIIAPPPPPKKNRSKAEYLRSVK